MSFDLNILCVNQKRRIKNFPETINIYVEAQNKNRDKYPKFYGEYFPLMNAIKGIWYYLKDGKENISSFDLCDMDMEYDCYLSESPLSRKKELYPFWYDLNEELDSEVVLLKEKYKEDVLRTMQLLIENSPIRQIIFLAKYQIVDNREFIYGTISFDKFTELLENKRILFNTCYVIEENKLNRVNQYSE